MDKLIRIHVDATNKEYIDEKIENDKLFLFCRETVEDDFDVYCRKGEFYTIIDDTESAWIVNGDDCLLSVKKDDPSFTLIAIEGGEG